MHLGGLNWEHEREKGVMVLMQIHQLSLQRLWDPPVVEEEYVK